MHCAAAIIKKQIAFIVSIRSTKSFFPSLLRLLMNRNYRKITAWMCVTSRIVKRGNNKTEPTNQKQPHVSVLPQRGNFLCFRKTLWLNKWCFSFCKICKLPVPFCSAEQHLLIGRKTGPLGVIVCWESGRKPLVQEVPTELRGSAQHYLVLHFCSQLQVCLQSWHGSPPHCWLQWWSLCFSCSPINHSSSVCLKNSFLVHTSVELVFSSSSTRSSDSSGVHFGLCMQTSGVFYILRLNARI